MCFWIVIIRLLNVKIYRFEFIGEITHDHWRMGMPSHQWYFVGQWRGLIGE
jgi:hypothetical protein